MQPVFLPLYNLHLIYGKIFRLSFGPKSFVVISDNQIAKEASAAPAATYLRRPQPSRSPPGLGPQPAARRRRQVLMVQAKSFSKGLLAEILEFVMGTASAPQINIR